jgi:branched-chain amino acid transport system permease protein
MIARTKIGLRFGLIAFGLVFFLSIIGLPLPSELRGIGGAALYLFALMVGLVAYVVLRDTYEERRAVIDVIVNGTLIGLIAGVGFALVTAWFASLQADGVAINTVLAQMLPEHTGSLTGLTKQEVLAGAPIGGALLRLVVIITAGGLAGALLTRIYTEEGKAGVSRFGRSRTAHYIVLSLPFLFFLLFLLISSNTLSVGGNDENIIGLVILFVFVSAVLIALRRERNSRIRLGIGIAFAVMMLLLPQFTDQFQETVLAKIVIYAVMGLGLNIVLGYAGMFHIGLIVFFGIGAYVYGLLSAPGSYLVETLGWGPISFWPGLLLAIVFGALVSVFIGFSILRTRGDYLAIVTLGFVQISYLMLLNLRDYTGGPGGVLNIPPPELLGRRLVSPSDPSGVLYMGLVLLAIAVFISLRLYDSRIGRSWRAMKEDEDVAQTMGINLAKTKLIAFAIGGALAGAAGTLYATRQINIFPDNFDLLESINLLSLVIIGGLGSIEGVILGSVALAGLPEVLRGVDEYRIVAFGALLIIMMIVRPQGLLPPLGREEEIRADDRAQDAWLKIYEADEKSEKAEIDSAD